MPNNTLIGRETCLQACGRAGRGPCLQSGTNNGRGPDSWLPGPATSCPATLQPAGITIPASALVMCQLLSGERLRCRIVAQLVAESGVAPSKATAIGAAKDGPVGPQLSSGERLRY